MPRIRLLGGASIQDSATDGSGRAVQRARMALLALVALSRTRSITRERAMAFLWPDSSTDRARQSLRECLYRLRETMGDDALQSAGDEIRLERSQIECDVWAFEEAVGRGEWRQADDLYAGPLLDGVFLSSGAEFEQWVDAERERLRALHAQVVEALANECVGRRDLAGAVGHWRRRVAMEPHNAHVALRLMEALDAAGDRAGALRLAEAHASLLQSELAATPDPAVAAFAERLRRNPPERPLPSVRADADSGAVVTPASSPKRAPAPETDARGFFARRSVQRWLAAACAILLVTAAVRISTAGHVVDPNRIAILPFRTSGADPSLAPLHDGLVELLSAELTGDVGPAAIEAGEVLRAWQRIDGDRNPTTRDVALRAGRLVGAAQVAYGAVTGTADAFTATLTVLDVPGGATRIDRVQVSGALDSLPQLVAGLSARLRARNAGTWTLSAADPEQTSTEVLRAYLDGMVAYRRANWALAGTELRRAAELDSTFAPAAYRLALIHAMLAPRTPFDERPTPDARRRALFRRLWNHRRRLSADQRVLLNAVADSNYVRWRMQALRHLERAVELMPTSVEAWDILGDDYFHAGALVGLENWAEHAKRAFLRAREIDSTTAVNARAHLADLAFMERDAEAHAQFAVAKVGLRGPHYLGYQAALVRENPESIRAARTAYARSWARGEEDGLDWAFRGLTIPHDELDSLVHEFESRASTKEQRDLVTRWQVRAAYMEGRPRAAALLSLATDARDTITEFIAALERAEFDSLAAERLTRAKLVDPVHPYECEVRQARLRRGDTTGVRAHLASEPAADDGRSATELMSNMHRGLGAQSRLCRQVLRAVFATLSSDQSPAARALLFRADSMMKLTTINYGPWWNYDLGVAFARRGDYAAAAAAVRRRFVDAADDPRLVLALRQEGKWAALAGQTAAAIKAYEHYLLWRSNPEPALIPQRDSVRAELAAISRARR